MTDEQSIGKDLVENVFNRVLRIYLGVLTDESNPLRKNELLGPIVKNLEGVDSSFLVDLLEHSTLMVMHALFDHIQHFESVDGGYSLQLNVIHQDGSSEDMLAICEDPGGQLVEDGGWADKFSDFR